MTTDRLELIQKVSDFVGFVYLKKYGLYKWKNENLLKFFVVYL